MKLSTLNPLSEQEKFYKVVYYLPGEDSSQTYTSSKGHMTGTLKVMQNKAKGLNQKELGKPENKRYRYDVVEHQF